MKKNLDFPHPLYEVFGGGSAIILDVFLWLRQYDYSEAEIARKTNLSRKTVSNEIRKLLKKKILKLTRQSGKSRMYLFNDIPENAWLKIHFDSKVKNITGCIECNISEEDKAKPMEQLIREHLKSQEELNVT